MSENRQEDFTDFDEDIDFYDDDDDEEICGYVCLCCGSTLSPEDCDGDDCPYCMSNALDEIYF